jgi:hypothetical protein
MGHEPYRRLPLQSLTSSGAANPPSLLVRPFHQSGSVPSLRVFTNNAFNHHHAATMAVPGRVIPNDERIESAIWRGEKLFEQAGCASCHTPALPLDRKAWIFSEPGPFNPAGNEQAAAQNVIHVDLTDERLPLPRLRAQGAVLLVPAYTDLKLHDITSGPRDPNREPIDMNQPAGSRGFFAGNSRFLTRKLWGVANEPPYFHHGQYTTLREAVLAHDGALPRSEVQRSGYRHRIPQIAANPAAWHAQPDRGRAAAAQAVAAAGQMIRVSVHAALTHLLAPPYIAYGSRHRPRRLDRPRRSPGLRF